MLPPPYEQRLLVRFEAGELTLDQVAALLDERVYQLLYHSRATELLTEGDLQQLLEQAREFNARHDLTGLLLYRDGYFLQLLEGTEATVGDLYAHIQRDPRHSQVVTVRQGREPRQFAGWSMDYGHVTAQQFEQALVAVQGRLVPPDVTEPRLQALLRALA